MLQAFLSGSTGGCEGGIITDIARPNKAVNRSQLLLGSQSFAAIWCRLKSQADTQSKSLSAHEGVPKIRAGWSENTAARCSFSLLLAD